MELRAACLEEIAQRAELLRERLSDQGFVETSLVVRHPSRLQQVAAI
jgi:hypothetical protein